MRGEPYGHWSFGPEDTEMRRLIWLLLLLAAWLILQGRAPAADQCVACHTDPARLQALVKAPTEIPQEEGEG